MAKDVHDDADDDDRGDDETHPQTNVRWEWESKA